MGEVSGPQRLMKVDDADFNFTHLEVSEGGQPHKSLGALLLLEEQLGSNHAGLEQHSRKRSARVNS